MPDLKTNISVANFKYVTNWQSATYFSLQRQMGEISSYGALTPMGPLLDTGDIDKVGDIVGITSDRDAIYVAVLEGTTTVIYKGKERKGLSGELQWQWCPWVYLGTNACTTIKVIQHSATDRRLWFGYGTHTGYVYLTENPTADANARFAAQGYVRMSYDYGTNPYWDKLFQTVVTETAGCASDASQTVAPEFRKDSETSDSALTAGITTNGVVLRSLTGLINCKKIQFKLSLSTSNPTLTPQVLFFQARGIERPEAIRVHDVTYALGDNPSRRTETFRSALRTARSSTSLVRLADLRYGGRVGGTAGTDFVYVVCQPGYPQEVEIAQETGRAPELGLKVRWQEVTVA